MRKRIRIMLICCCLLVIGFITSCDKKSTSDQVATDEKSTETDSNAVITIDQIPWSFTEETDDAGDTSLQFFCANYSKYIVTCVTVNFIEKSSVTQEERDKVVDHICELRNIEKDSEAAEGLRYAKIEMYATDYMMTTEKLVLEPGENTRKGMEDAKHYVLMYSDPYFFDVIVRDASHFNLVEPKTLEIEYVDENNKLCTETYDYIEKLYSIEEKGEDFKNDKQYYLGKIYTFDHDAGVVTKHEYYNETVGDLEYKMAYSIRENGAAVIYGTVKNTNKEKSIKNAGISWDVKDVLGNSICSESTLIDRIEPESCAVIIRETDVQIGRMADLVNIEYKEGTKAKPSKKAVKSTDYSCEDVFDGTSGDYLMIRGTVIGKAKKAGSADIVVMFKKDGEYVFSKYQSISITEKNSSDRFEMYVDVQSENPPEYDEYEAICVPHVYSR